VVFEIAIMIGTQPPQKELFSYHINLDQRVRDNHPLRKINEVVDFQFVRAEVAHLYGYNGNESVPPETILKMMFLLFFDDVSSERELMRIIPERLDYLWFLGYELDDPIPDHSVLSKARKRWGPVLFETFFVRTVGQCVAAGLVDGKKIHVDASLNDANASCDSVAKASPELIAALKAAYQAVESKLEDTTTPKSYEAVNDRVMSTTDPDAAVVRKGHQPPRPRYHHHRVVDDAQGVITALETTPGSVAENRRLLSLMDQHQAHTALAAETVVADRKYGTVENFVACQQRGVTTHMGDARGPQPSPSCKDIFPDTAFHYEAANNTYRCPAGHTMRPRRLHPKRRTWEYHLPKAVCAACALRAQCTHAANGRTIHRHEHQALLDRARAQAHSEAARRDRQRRQHLAEGSFADAANNHGFKRARWRRLWRVQMQDYLIAAIQNVKILVKHLLKPAHAGAAAMSATVATVMAAVLDFAAGFFPRVKAVRPISLPELPSELTGYLSRATCLKKTKHPFGQHALET
jgi:transposase